MCLFFLLEFMIFHNCNFFIQIFPRIQRLVNIIIHCKVRSLSDVTFSYVTCDIEVDSNSKNTDYVSTILSVTIPGG